MSYSSAMKAHYPRVPSIGGTYRKTYVEELRESILPMTVLADEVFGMFDDNLPVVDGSSFYEMSSNPNLTHDTETQLELPLEDSETLQRHYRYMIGRYERAYEHMAMLALKWHYLEQDVEDNGTIKKMFNDMQVMRKLSGCTLI